MEYLKHCMRAGLGVDDIAPQFSFFFGCHNNFLEEVAKFRAARRLWAKIVKEKFGAKNPKSMMLRFHTQTDGCTLTAQQPGNNTARITLQALAAVFGGTQSLHTNSFDEALGLPTEESVMAALRTQQIIAEESGMADTVDPLGGSYAIESLTSSIEAQAQAYIRRIDEIGGMVRAIENGFVQREIQERSYEHQKAVENGEVTVVGVNKYQMKDKANPHPTRGLLRRSLIEGGIKGGGPERKQLLKLKKIKKRRDNGSVEKGLRKLDGLARSGENLFPVMIELVENHATVGEICDILRNVFGEYRPGREI